MRHRIALGLIGVTVVAAATAGAFAIDHYQHQPDPIQLVPLSRLQESQEATLQATLEQKRLQVNLDASKHQLSTTQAQKAAACADLVKYRIKSAACN